MPLSDGRFVGIATSSTSDDSLVAGGTPLSAIVDIRSGSKRESFMHGPTRKPCAELESKATTVATIILGADVFMFLAFFAVSRFRGRWVVMWVL